MSITQPTPEQTYLFVLLSAETTIQAMEQLQGSNVYRQELKASGNRFMRELISITSKDMALVWGESDETLYKLLDYHKEMIKNIVGLLPEEADVVNCMIGRYKEKPEAVREMLQIQFVDNG